MKKIIEYIRRKLSVRVSLWVVLFATIIFIVALSFLFFQAREAVRKERRMELAFENQRWFDLLRWGNATTTVNNYLSSEDFYRGYKYDVNPIVESQVFLPIPVDVLDINPDVAQNVGY